MSRTFFNVKWTVFGITLICILETLAPGLRFGVAAADPDTRSISKVQAFHPSAAANITVGTGSLPLYGVTGTQVKNPLAIVAGKNGGVWLLHSVNPQVCEIREWNSDTPNREIQIGGKSSWVPYRGLLPSGLSRVAGGSHATVFYYEASTSTIIEDDGVETVSRTGKTKLADEPRDLAVDLANNVWYLNGAGQLRTTGNNLPAQPPTNLLALDVDLTGNLWLVDEKGGIHCLDQAGHLTDLASGSAIACGGDGSVWVLDPTRHILRRREGTEWRDKVILSPTSAPIREFAVDSRGCPWLITDSRIYTTQSGMNSGFERAPIPPSTKPPLPARPKDFLTDFLYGGINGSSIWYDNVSGDFQIAFYPAPTPPGYVCFGDYAHPNHDFPTGVSMLVAKDDPVLFQPPRGYTKIYSNEGAKANRVSIWEPIPPDGYRQLGHVAVAGDGPPKTTTLRCVKASLTAPGSIIGPLYVDKGTHADAYCSIYAIGVTFRNFLLEEKMPAFKTGLEWAKWVAAKTTKAVELELKKKSYRANYLAPNCFWASNKKDWKVSASDARTYVLKAPSVGSLTAYLQQCAPAAKWQEAVTRWKNWRTFLWKKEELFRQKAEEFRQQKFKELMEASLKASLQPSLATEPRSPLPASSTAMVGYKEFKEQFQAGTPLPVVSAAASGGLPAFPPLPSNPFTLSKPISSPNLSDATILKFRTFLKTVSPATPLRLASLDWFKAIPDAEKMELQNATWTLTPTHLIGTGQLIWFGKRDAKAFVTIHAGIDGQLRSCVGILPGQPVKISDCITRPTSPGPISLFDSCLVLTRTAHIYASDDDQLDGTKLFTSPQLAAEARTLLDPIAASNEFQVGLKKGQNLFAISTIPATSPLTFLTKIPGWPQTIYWKGLLSSDSEALSLQGSAKSTLSLAGLSDPATITIGLNGKGVLSLGWNATIKLFGTPLTFALALTKELGKAGSLAECSLVGSAICGNKDCQLPCRHLRVKLPVGNFSLSKLILKFAQEADEKTKVIGRSFGLAGSLAVGTKQFEIATRFPLPPKFDKVAFRGQTTEPLLFHDLLLLLGAVAKGLDEKVGPAIPDFGLTPLMQTATGSDGTSKKIPVILISLAKDKDDDLGIPKGITLKGGLRLLDRDLGAIDLQIDEAGLLGSGTLKDLDLGILKIQGRDKSSGPRFEARLNMAEQELVIKGKARLLGLSEVNLDLKLKSSGLSAAFTARAFGKLEADVTLTGQLSTNPEFTLALKLKSDFIDLLKPMIANKITGSLFGGVTPFQVRGATARGTLRESDSVFDLVVNVAIFGIPQDITFARFDLANPEKSLEEIARRIADLILSKGADLAAEAEKFVVASVEIVNSRVNQGLGALSQATKVDIIGVKKGLDSLVSEGYDETKNIAQGAINTGVSVTSKTVQLATSIARAVTEKVESFFKDLARDGGYFNPANW